MPITPRFTRADIEKELLRRANKINAAIIQRLQMLGEACLNEARTNRTFTDQTGNLISSMGYVIVDHGKIIGQNGFNQTVSASGTASKFGEAGSLIGETLAKSLSNQHANSFALYVVAGMNYAAAVESRGKNVLTSAELYAQTEMPKLMARLAKNIEKMK